MDNSTTGVWATMITPFDQDGRIDYAGLEALIEWYLSHKVTGLFAVCKSSESFFMDQDERLSLASFIVKTVNTRVPVIAGGNYSNGLEDQREEVKRMADTGVDAVVLLSSMVAAEAEDDALWRGNMGYLLDSIDPGIPLGIYESPAPYPRTMSPENLRWCVDTGRFLFLKDTCCRISLIKEKLSIVSGSPLKIYNAHTSSLLESLKYGAFGYSSLMSNISPCLYDWLIENHKTKPERSQKLQYFLSVADAAVVSRCYPASAKYYLTLEGLPLSVYTRAETKMPFSEYTEETMQHLWHLNGEYKERYGIR